MQKCTLSLFRAQYSLSIFPHLLFTQYKVGQVWKNARFGTVDHIAASGNRGIP